MKRGIYVVRDMLAGDYVGQPLFFPHDAVAVRMFSDVVSDPKSQFRQHPKDFALVRLGTVDSTDGVCECLNPPEVVISADVVLAIAVDKAEAEAYAS